MLFDTDEYSPAENEQVPSSGRGGLGNIRAKQQTSAKESSKKQVKTKTKTKTSPSSFRFRAGLKEPERASFVSGSTGQGQGPEGSSGASVYSNSSSAQTRTFSSSARSRSSEADADGSLLSPYPDDEYQEPPSPLSSQSPFSLAASGSAIAIASGTGTGTGSTSTDYAAHLHADARQRALEKRHARARAREARVLSGTVSISTGEDGVMVEDTAEEKVVRVRTGRGGAGVYKKVGGGVDPALHPRAAGITLEYEARFAALERTLVAASRARAAAHGSTGRGGAGNIASVSESAFGASSSKGKGKGKNVSGSKLARMERAAGKVKWKGKGKGKGKGKVESFNVIEVDARVSEEAELTLEELAALEGGETVLSRSQSLPSSDIPQKEKENDDSEVAKMKEQARGQQNHPGLRRLWKCVTGSGVVSSHLPSREDTHPVQTAAGGDHEVLEIGHGTDVDISSASGSQPPSSSLRVQRITGAKLRKPSTSSLRSDLRKRERERKKEGDALLAFVNSALPDLPRNVLGVPGTPGFPAHAGSKNRHGSRNEGGSEAGIGMAGMAGVGARKMASSMVSTLVTTHVHEENRLTERVLRIEELEEEEEWVDDVLDGDTLQEVDDENVDEEEDSDIDPQGHPSPFKLHPHQRQHHQYEYDFTRSYGKRPDSLDVVIRVALDKLDRGAGAGVGVGVVDAWRSTESFGTFGPRGKVPGLVYSDPDSRVGEKNEGGGGEEEEDEGIIDPYAFTEHPTPNPRTRTRTRPPTGVNLTPNPGTQTRLGAMTPTSVSPPRVVFSRTGAQRTPTAPPPPLIVPPPRYLRASAPVVRARLVAGAGAGDGGRAGIGGAKVRSAVPVPGPGPPPARPVPRLPE